LLLGWVVGGVSLHVHWCDSGGCGLLRFLFQRAAVASHLRSGGLDKRAASLSPPRQSAQRRYSCRAAIRSSPLRSGGLDGRALLLLTGGWGREGGSSNDAAPARVCAAAPRRCLSSAHEAASAAGLDVAPSISEIGVRKLYRDCLKLTYHIAANSAKGDGMRQMVRSSFRAQMHVTDEAEISRLKLLAVKGLQNYVIMESTNKAVARKRDGLD
jgi:hypothetical protein